MKVRVSAQLIEQILRTGAVIQQSVIEDGIPQTARLVSVYMKPGAIVELGFALEGEDAPGEEIKDVTVRTIGDHHEGQAAKEEGEGQG